MGALPIIGDIASGVSSVTGVGSAIAGANYNDRALAMQQQENALNRQFQSAEAEKERSFAAGQTQQLLQYNSAPAQVERLRQAGINPATAFSNSAGSAGSAMSPTRGAVPAGSSGLSIPSFISPMQEISASGAFLKSLADAYKTSEEGSKARELMASQIEKTMAEKDLLQLQQQGIRTANEIAMKTGLRKAEADIELILNQADLKIHEGALRIAEKDLTEAETNRQIEQLVGDVYDNVRKQFEAKYSKNKWRMSEVDVLYHKAEVLEGIKTMRSQQAANLASASRDSALGQYILSQRDEQVYMNTLRGIGQNGKVLDDYARFDNWSAWRASIRSAVAQAGISESQEQEAFYAAERACFANSNKELDFWIGKFTDIVGAGSSVVGAAAALRNAGAFGKIASSRMAEQEYFMNTDEYSKSWVDNLGNHYTRRGRR